MSYRVKGKTFHTIDEYFDYMADEFGYTPYHHYFTKDSVISDGFKLHLDIYEHHPDAPTIVLIPGTALYSLCYVEIMYKIGSQGFNFIGFDPRGHGRSQGNRGDYTIVEIIRDAEQVIEFAKKRFNSSISLLGSSQGGVVAFYLAAKEIGVKSVVCQNFADLTDPGTLRLARHPNLTRYLKPLLINFGEVFAETQVPINLYLNLEDIKIKRFGNAKVFLENDPLTLKTVSLRAIRSLTTTALHTKVEDIITPVMVFQGDEDSIFPVDYTQYIFNRLTCKKRFELFKGMNHALITDNVPDIAPPIVEWLKEIHC